MCTIFASRSQDHTLIGRNFDWIQRGGTIHLIPPGHSYGSTTYGLCLVEQMGADEPFEGINTQGVFIGMAAVPTLRPLPQIEHPRFSELGIIRYALERASTAEQALQIFQSFALEYRMARWGFHHHHLIADAQGYVATYEEGSPTPLQSLAPTQWQAITNTGQGGDRMECPRYQAVARTLGDAAPDEQQARALLRQVGHPDMTVWSSVYDLRQPAISICIDGDYETTYRWDIREQTQRGAARYPFSQLKIENPRYIARYRYGVENRD